MVESTTWKSKRNTDRCLLGRLVFTAAVPKHLVGGREREQHRHSLPLFLLTSLSRSHFFRAFSHNDVSLPVVNSTSPVECWAWAVLAMQGDGREEGGENEGERERERHREWERGRSVSLAGFAAHLSEVCAAAKLEPEHQGAVCHCVHIFTLCRTQKKYSQSHAHFREMQYECQFLQLTNFQNKYFVVYSCRAMSKFPFNCGKVCRVVQGWCIFTKTRKHWVSILAPPFPNEVCG